MQENIFVHVHNHNTPDLVLETGGNHEQIY